MHSIQPIASLHNCPVVTLCGCVDDKIQLQLSRSLTTQISSVQLKIVSKCMYPKLLTVSEVALVFLQQLFYCITFAVCRFGLQSPLVDLDPCFLYRIIARQPL